MSPVPTLSDYQQVALERLLNAQRYGVFDEMGVGKTPVAIRAMQKVNNQKHPFLLTVPAYLMSNWRNEFAKWVPGATVAFAQGEKLVRDQALDSNADVIVCSYNAWHTHPQLFKRKWQALTFDEAHRLRGRNSKWTKAVFTTQNVDSKNRDSLYWFLTGTPVVRDAGDVWPFLHLCDRQVFRSYWSFVENQCHLNVTPWDREVGPVRDPDEFAALLGRYSIRRLQSEIPELASLEFVTKDITVEMPKSVRESLRKARKEFLIEHPDLAEAIEADGGGALVQKALQMATLPPTADKPKLRAFGDLLREELPQERVFVVAWYRASAREIAQVALNLKRPTVMITGDQTVLQKQHAVDTYNKNPRTVLVGTVAACKEGLNLQAGRQVVFMEEGDLWEDNRQVIGRCLRRGQEQKVQVRRFVTEGWPESNKHRAMLKRGRSNARSLLEEFIDGTSL
jgi:SNF2 family DNA or RNA helicase